MCSAAAEAAIKRTGAHPSHVLTEAICASMALALTCSGAYAVTTLKLAEAPPFVLALTGFRGPNNCRVLVILSML